MLDMTLMHAVHDAFRRDLARIASLTATPDDDPRHLLRTAAGWQMFTAYLRIHHTAEDVNVWPVMSEALAGRPDDLALLDAMEAEHAAIDPLLAAVDGALADRDGGPKRLGELVDALTTTLTGHLAHEEARALPLIDATMTEEQWQRFGADHRARIGANAPRYLPWVLDQADDERVGAVLARMPAPIRAAYADEWRPAYAVLNPWAGADHVNAGS